MALGDGAGLGEGELNKSLSSSSKRPEGFSMAALVSCIKRMLLIINLWKYVFIMLANSHVTITKVLASKLKKRT